MKKKQLIMENALYLFSEQGFEQTSIQQITDRAGISKGAFYLSFKSKDELIISLIEYFMKSLLIDIEQVVNSDDENKLKAYLTKLFGSIKKNAFFAKVLLNEKPACLHPIILEKVHSYYSLMTDTLITIIKEQYPSLKNAVVPEMIFLIQGLTACYGKLFFQETREIEINELVQNVYEKIDLLAKHASIGFITFNDIKLVPDKKITKEQLLQEIKKISMDMDDKELTETLQLLENQINELTYPLPVVNGLISLLKNNIKTSGIAILATDYFKGQK